MTTASVLVLHTTEGSSIAGAEAAFQANNSWPHLIFDPRNGQWKQYLDFSTAGRALRNMTGGVETNRRESDGLPGPDVIQVEIVGFAADTSNWPADWRLRLAQFVIELCERTGIPILFPCHFDGNDAYGLNGSVRCSNQEWLDVRGVVGHQHVPENTHWDPGHLGWLPPLIQEITMSLAPDERAQLFAILPALGDVEERIKTHVSVAVTDAKNQTIAAVNAAKDEVLAAVAAIEPGTGSGPTPDEIADELYRRLES
jgi:hypothetical protein